MNCICGCDQFTFNIKDFPLTDKTLCKECGHTQTMHFESDDDVD